MKRLKAINREAFKKAVIFFWGAGINESSNVETCQAINESSYTYCSSAIAIGSNIIHSSAILNSEYIHTSNAVLGSSYVLYSYAIKNSQFIAYSEALFSCMFCCELSAKKYYIFNKRYSKEEYYKHLQKIEAIIGQNPHWKPFELYRFGYNLKLDCEKKGFSFEKKAKEFPKELLRYIKKHFIKSEKEEEIFETIFQYKIGDCK